MFPKPNNSSHKYQVSLIATMVSYNEAENSGIIGNVHFCEWRVSRIGMDNVKMSGNGNGLVRYHRKWAIL
jgi:hypothetical protein